MGNICSCFSGGSGNDTAYVSSSERDYQQSQSTDHFNVRNVQPNTISTSTRQPQRNTTVTKLDGYISTSNKHNPTSIKSHVDTTRVPTRTSSTTLSYSKTPGRPTRNPSTTLSYTETQKQSTRNSSTTLSHAETPRKVTGFSQEHFRVTTSAHKTPSVHEADAISVIGSLIQRILLQSDENCIPTQLYEKLHKACVKVQRQSGPFHVSYGQGPDYHLRCAKELWDAGTKTRVDPSRFLTHILKALKQNPQDADIFLHLGLYLWEMFAELRLAKKFLDLSYQLQSASETCVYIVDLCMALNEKSTALDILIANLNSLSSNAEWAYLRMGLILSDNGDVDGAENWFRTAIPHSHTRPNRQPYECLGRNLLQMYNREEDAKQAFLNGSHSNSGFGNRSSTQLVNEARLEAANLRAMYSNAQQWLNRPEELGVQFAFSILFAICPALLRPIGYDFRRVHQARKDITAVYMKGGLLRPGQRVDWGEADKQCSYMLRFFLIHCQFLPRLLVSSPHILSRFPRGNHLRVCCVGGGPGSDIIGLLIYLRSIGRCARLTCHVLDKFPAWENVWKHIQPRLPPPSVDATYGPIDMTSSTPYPLNEDTEEIIQKADVITFVKSVSPVVAFLKNRWNSTTQGVIPSMLRLVKSGAIVIYIDNKVGDQNKLFIDMARSAGLVAIQNIIWECSIEGYTNEYNAVWSKNYNACSSCDVKGCVFYKP